MTLRVKRLISLLLIGLFFTLLLRMETQLLAFENNPGIHVVVNQIGYLPDMPKKVISSMWASEFRVIDCQNSRLVYKGKLVAFNDPTSRQPVWRGDFSDLHTLGDYRIEVPGVGSSYPFPIKTDIYNPLLKLSIRSYYFQRCGVDVSDLETGLNHPPCHTDDGLMARTDEFHQAGDFIGSRGGWHDAGDYGKYTTTTAVTAAQLMIAYELWPEKFTDGQLDIPESGNGLPDILDEVRIELNWLMTMQRPDGAVYHKLAGKHWAAFDNPDHDRVQRYIYGISTADTGKFAAAMAIATRVFREVDPEFAEKAERAAEKAWQYLSLHTFAWDHLITDDDGSGAYGSNDDQRDRLWAALELSALKTDYLPVAELKDAVLRLEPADIGWNNASLLGLFDYIRSSHADPGLSKMAAAKLTETAERNIQAAKKSGYEYTLGFSQFYWASNKEGLSRGITLVLANIIAAKPEYRKIALAQLDFILGFNPLSKCFVSGAGSNPVTKLHHRWCDSAGKPIPGLLAGGPNNRAESGVEPYGKGPFSYLDATASYSSNEPAIDYNAALVFLTAAFAKP